MATTNGTIDLSFKRLSEIPEEVLLNCNDVYSLNLAGNPGIELHNSIGQFQHLRKLVLSHCSASSIPDEICDLRELQVLELEGSYFYHGLHPAISILYTLKRLNLKNCRLPSLPYSIGCLENLEELILEDNNFSAGLTPYIRKLRKLKKLNLNNCNLRSLPESIRHLKKLEELELEENLLDCLNPVIGQLHQLKRLNLKNCDVPSLPMSFRQLKSLEELDLRGSSFSGVLDLETGQMFRLRKLDLSDCELTTLTDNIINLKQLEELHLRFNSFVGGLHPAIGRLVRLRTLDLSYCKLRGLTDNIGHLRQLEELLVEGNDFSAGLNPVIGRLRQLKRLNLKNCLLRSLPESIAQLKQLKELELEGNDFYSGLSPAVGLLAQLNTLNLENCNLRVLPDSVGRLKQLRVLLLSRNCLTEYPSCTLHLQHLEKVDLSYPIEQKKPSTIWKNFWDSLKTIMRPSREIARLEETHLQNGATQRLTKPGISVLPIELAYANIKELKLNGNPVTEPPKGIWIQGLDAIKSYLSAKSLGSDEFCPDTINMVGDVCAGKTSIAQSLVQRSPHPADQDDRTRVMQQLRATFGEDDKLLVNINDFGGHDIYHAVIPIFLPTDGLVLLAFDMSLSLKDQECTVRRWLLTAIAKCRNIRVIVVGTRCDAISLKERECLEKHMTEFTLSVLDEVKYELKHHINCIEELRSTYQYENKLKHLRNLLSRLEMADISVACLSCIRCDQGLNVLYDDISKKLRCPESLPRRWFLFMKSVLNASSKRPFLTWSEVQKLYKERVDDANDDKNIVVILRYLVSTSQIFWLEHHSILKEFVFHSTESILNVCKEVLDHDQFRQWANHRLHAYSKDIERYSKGLVHHPFLIALLSNQEIATVAVQFLQNFNLISETITDHGTRVYVIPSNLPAEEPQQVSELQLKLQKCPNSIVIKLSFLGSVLPMSFLETSLSSMMTVAKRLTSEGMSTQVWRDGLIILHESVCFSARRDNNVLVFAAFSERATSSPWVILLPIMRSVHENVTASWHGATPECVLMCPVCRLNHTTKGKVGEIEMTLEMLTSEVKNERGNLMCSQCIKTIPLCLCFPTARGCMTAEDEDEVKMFFQGHGMAVSDSVHRSVSTITKPLVAHSDGGYDNEVQANEKFSELQNKWWKSAYLLKNRIELDEISDTMDYLLNKELISVDNWERIQELRSRRDAVTLFTKIVGRLSDEAIDACLVYFESRGEPLADLSKLIRDGSAA